MLNGLNILTATAPSYTATKSGAYVCIVCVSGSSGSCVVPTAVIPLVALPAPTPPITYSTNLLATSPTYASYQWFRDNLGVPGATYSSFVPTGNGAYRVVVTDAKGCPGSSTAIVIKSVGIEEVNKAEVKIYPNPANSFVHIDAPVNVRAVISGVEGKTVMQIANAKDVNISNLANGLYIIMLFDDNGDRLAVQKLIKE